MNPLTLEWISKAEGDFSTAGRELKTRKSPNYDAVCFHSQQATEKYLKAFLQENGQTIPKTHVLLDLLALCLKIEPAFQIIRADLNTLEGYAIQFRYPGQSADKIEAKAAYKTAATARDFIRNQMGLN
jgi:HEPN domain-containing protein